jgi:hypothetical protein
LNRRLIGSEAVVAELAKRNSAAGAGALAASAAGVSQFMALRQKYLIYR